MYIHRPSGEPPGHTRYKTLQTGVKMCKTFVSDRCSNSVKICWVFPVHADWTWACRSPIFFEFSIKICTSGCWGLQGSSSPWSDWVRYPKLRCAGAVWESRLLPPAGPSGNRTWNSPAFWPVPSSLYHSHRRNHTCLTPKSRNKEHVSDGEAGKEQYIDLFKTPS